MAAKAGHILEAFFCFPCKWLALNQVFQSVFSVSVCVCVCVCLKPALQHFLCKQVLHLLSSHRSARLLPLQSILRHFLLFFMRNKVLGVRWSMWIGRITPPCLTVELGGARSGPWRSRVYSWSLLMGSVGSSGTSPRMSLRQTGRSWLSAGSARCTRSSSKARGRNVSLNAFTLRCVPKAPTGGLVLPF